RHFRGARSDVGAGSWHDHTVRRAAVTWSLLAGRAYHLCPLPLSEEAKMTTDLTFLLSKGFVPIVQHNSVSFQFLEEEARKASAGLLGEQVAFHVLRSDKSNAYVVRTPTRFFIGITDTLLQDLSFDILDLLGQSDIAEFF